MNTLATISDLNQRREKALTEQQRNRAEALLTDATVLVTAEFTQRGKILDDWLNASDENKAAACAVCCNVVNRALRPVEVMGVTQYTQSVDIHSASYTYSNPDGNLYLTANDRRMLGLTGNRAAFSLSPWKNRGEYLSR